MRILYLGGDIIMDNIRNKNDFKNAQCSTNNDFRDSQDNRDLRNSQNDNNFRNAQNSSNRDLRNTQNNDFRSNR